MNLSRFVGELKRRHVFRVVLGYGAAAFVVAQVAELYFDRLGLPEAATTFVVALTVLGFPVAVALAWAFDVTPEGVKRTDEPAAPADTTPEPRREPAAASRAPAGMVRIPRLVPPVGAGLAAASTPAEPDLPAEPPDPVRIRRAALAQVRQELSAPINAVLGYSEMLLEDASSRGHEAAVADLRKISQAGRSLLGLVESTLQPERGALAELEQDPEGFAARLRHDLRTPINAIIGYGELLAEGFQEAGETGLQRETERVVECGRHLLRLVDEVVRFASMGEPEEPDSAQLSRAEAIAREALTHIRPLDVGAAEGGDLHASSLLVVDDNPTNRDLLCRQLVRQGYTVSTAETGGEALQTLQQQEFDLVLLDILMPGVSGVEVLQRMKADPALRDIAVIMISALDETDTAVRCIEMGAEDYLPKPFDPVLLGARIERSLQARRLRQREQEYLERIRVQDDWLERRLQGCYPAGVAERIRHGETDFTEAFPEATVLWAEVDGLARIAARGRAGELVEHLGRLFAEFEQAAELRGVDTVKCLGRSFVAAAGVPLPRSDHLEIAADLALEMLAATARYAAECGEPLQLRAGLHTGPALAGMLQNRGASYDVWGDCVDTARSLCQGGPGCVQISPAAQARLRELYSLESRGIVEVAGKGQMRTYLLWPAQPCPDPAAI